jgi:3-oxoacyl-[acyl-carrier protein] reductase
VDLGLNGKVALVAAASKGLGRAVAEGFAREGANVAICGREEASITAVAKEISAATGAKVLPVAADVTNPADITRFVETTVSEFGRLDSLICNAGGPPPGGFADLDDAAWDKAYQITMMSAVRLIRAALPALRESGTGRIISMASSSVKQPIPGLLLSNTFRLGLHGMIKTISDEFASDGILVNTVGPGRFDTDRVRSLDAGRAAKAGISVEEQRTRTQKEIALGRYGQAEEFARYVVFLGSPANTYVTGQSLLADGGLTRAL